MLTTMLAFRAIFVLLPVFLCPDIDCRKISIPIGADIVLNPITNLTWWISLPDGEILVDVNSDNYRIDSHGRLLMTVNNSGQCGTYKVKSYNRRKSKEITETIYPTIAAYISDLEDSEDLSCSTLKESMLIIKCNKNDSCVDNIRLYIDTTEKRKPRAILHCKDHNDQPYNIITSGAVIMFSPSLAAKWWWKSNKVAKPNVMNIRTRNVKIDEYGQLKLRITNVTQSGVYMLHLHRKWRHVEEDWPDTVFEEIYVDTGQTTVDGTITIGVGESATLECALPGLDITWYRDGSSDMLHRGLTFTISNVTVSDRGDYVCYTDTKRKGSIGQLLHVGVTEDPAIHTVDENGINEDKDTVTWVLIPSAVAATCIIVFLYVVHKRKRKNSGPTDSVAEGWREHYRKYFETHYRTSGLEKKSRKGIISILSEGLPNGEELLRILLDENRRNCIIMASDVENLVSSILSNLCWLWTRNHRSMQIYNLVIHTNLGEIRDETLTDIIEKKCDRELGADEGDNMLQHQILWIVDGDLNSLPNESELLQLVNGNIYPNVSVIVNTLPNHIELLLGNMSRTCYVFMQKEEKKELSKIVQDKALLPLNTDPTALENIDIQTDPRNLIQKPLGEALDKLLFSMKHTGNTLTGLFILDKSDMGKVRIIGKEFRVDGKIIARIIDLVDQIDVEIVNILSCSLDLALLNKMTKKCNELKLYDSNLKLPTGHINCSLSGSLVIENCWTNLN